MAEKSPNLPEIDPADVAKGIVEYLKTKPDQTAHLYEVFTDVEERLQGQSALPAIIDAYTMLKAESVIRVGFAGFVYLEGSLNGTA